MDKPKPTKVGRLWFYQGEKLSLYELYLVFGQSPEFRQRHGVVKPSQFTPEMVEEYLVWKAK